MRPRQQAYNLLPSYFYSFKTYDRPKGNDGDDVLTGTANDDMLVGGSDVFVVAMGASSDTIADFTLAEGDRIGLADGLMSNQTA